MKKTILLMLMASVTVVSCKKDDEPTPEPTKTQHLTASSWTVSAMTIDPPYPVNGTTVTDFYAQLETCDKDDVFSYNTNGTVVNDEGATKCDPADPQSELGTWAFNPGETAIIETFDGVTTTYNLLELNSTTLKINYIYTEDNIKYTLTVTFKH